MKKGDNVIMWDYAKLSKDAKELGGPEKLLETIKKSAELKGKQSMAPWLFVMFVLGGGALYGCKKFCDFFKNKKFQTQAKIDAVNAEIIKGIKDYDDTHPCENMKEINEALGEEVSDYVKKEI